MVLRNCFKMVKVRGLNLNENFYNYFLECLSLNGINEDILSQTEFKGLVNEFKERYKYNKIK